MTFFSEHILVRTSLSRCLYEIDAGPPPLCLLLSSYQTYPWYLCPVFVLAFLGFFSRVPFFALLSSLKGSTVNISPLLVHSLSTDKTLTWPHFGQIGTRHLAAPGEHAKDLREGQLWFQNMRWCLTEKHPWGRQRENTSGMFPRNPIHMTLKH